MGDFEAGALASVESTVKYHPCVTSALTAVRDPAAGHCQVGSLTGAVASILGLSSGNAGGTYLAVCWDIRLLGRESNPLPISTKGVKNPGLLSQISENVSGADNQQGSLRDPSTTVRRTSFGMMRQSELPSDRKLSDQHLALHT